MKSDAGESQQSVRDATPCQTFLLTFIWPKAGLTHDKFGSYWRDVHGPGTVSNYGDYLRWYSQHAAPLQSDPEKPCGVALMAFTDRARLDAMRSHRVESDAPNFMDTDRTVSITVEQPSYWSTPETSSAASATSAGAIVAAIACRDSELESHLGAARDALAVDPSAGMFVFRSGSQVDPRGAPFAAVVIAIGHRLPSSDDVMLKLPTGSLLVPVAQSTRIDAAPGGVPGPRALDLETSMSALCQVCRSEVDAS